MKEAYLAYIPTAQSAGLNVPANERLEVPSLTESSGRPGRDHGQ